MKLHDIEIDEAKLAEFCKTNEIREMLFFGSITQDNFHPDSDIDILVEFHPGRKPDLWTFIGLQMQLSELLGRTSHLHTSPMIDKRFYNRVMRSARVAYAA